MYLFAYEMKIGADNLPVDGKGDEGAFPIFSFNSFLESFYSVVVVLINDGWSMIYFDVYRCYNGIIAVIYFLTLLFVG